MKRLALALILLATPVIAQQQTPTEQALGDKVLLELKAGLTCNVSLITVQAELAKAQARIKELEPKPDAKAPPPNNDGG